MRTSPVISHAHPEAPTRGVQIELEWVRELIEARDRLDDVEARYTRHVVSCWLDPGGCLTCLDLAREMSSAHDHLSDALAAIPEVAR